MERYDYREAVYEDVKQYIEENITLSDYDNLEEAYEKIYDDMWITDSVTGNGSGSYTFNTWQAEENLCHNLDLLNEALTEFCCNSSYLAERGAEVCDVTIRCYLLGEVLQTVLKEININDDIWSDEQEE